MWLSICSNRLLFVAVDHMAEQRLGTLYLQIKRPDDSIECFQKAVSLAIDLGLQSLQHSAQRQLDSLWHTMFKAQGSLDTGDTASLRPRVCDSSADSGSLADLSSAFWDGSTGNSDTDVPNPSHRSSAPVGRTFLPEAYRRNPAPGLPRGSKKSRVCTIQ